MPIPVLKRLQNVLAHYGLESQSNIEICSTSGINEVFFVNTERGRIALKHHIQNSNLIRLQQEVALATQLTRHGIPCPETLNNQSGEPITEYNNSELYVATEYVDGSPFPTGSALKEKHIINAAQALAKFHKIGQEESAFLLSKRLCAYDLTKLTNRLMTYRCELHTLEHKNHCAAAMLSLIHSAMPKAMGLPRTLSAQVLAGCPKVIIHGEFHSSNILVNDAGEIEAFLDLDNAREDLRIYDLYQLVLYCVDQGFGQQDQGSTRTDGWCRAVQVALEAYNEIEKLTQEELKAFPTLAQVHFLHELGDERLDLTDRACDITIAKLQRSMACLEADAEILTQVTSEFLATQYAECQSEL